MSPLVSSLPEAASWLEDDGANTDGFNTNNLDGTFVGGTPYVVSDPALVVPPVAVNDNATATRNTPLTINELANDDIIVPLNPASVTIVTNVAHGTTAVQSNGSVLYTPAAGYVGTDSFTYHVADTDGRVSNTATVNINVVLAPAPIAGAVAATTLRNEATTINVLADDSATAPATLTPSSVTVVTAPTDGTAVVQSNGSVLYTPHTGFVGTDTFTYTVTDSNVETSSPGTVTVSVNTPTPPTANSDSFTTTEGAPLSLNVLANDTMGSVAIDPTTVDVDATPLHGTAVAQPDGSILYTPAGGFIGNDSFTYSVSDTLGEVSNVALVNLVISAGIPPVAADFSANTLAGQANTINLIANVTSGATLTPSTLTATGASHGTLTVGTDGTVSYTPTAGYVGSDSFTYNVGDVNTDTSNNGTVSVLVGTSITNAKGKTHSVSFTDGTGGLQTITLSTGTANIFFSGSGTLAVAKNGAASITGGTSLEIGSIALTGTTAASSLSIHGLVTKPVTIGGISDTSPLGKITAASAALTGAINLNSVGTLQVASIAGAAITIGSGLPGRVSLTAGAVTDSSLTSSVPIASLKVASWTDGSPQSIVAPSITSLTVAGAFDPSLTLSPANKTTVIRGIDYTLTDTSGGIGLGSARIGGAISGGTWNVAGSITSVSAKSIASAWVGNVNGSFGTLTINSGGLASPLTAESLGTLSIGGDLSSNITTAYAKTIRITGGIDGSTLSIGLGGISTLQAGGAVSSATITSLGDIGTITAGSLSDSNITAGVTAGTTFASATSALLGSDTITSVKLAGKTPTFTDTNILAGKITSASLGTVTTDNSGVAFGLATNSISSFAGIFANGPAHVGRTQLLNDAVLATYLTQQSVVFGDFAIDIES